MYPVSWTEQLSPGGQGLIFPAANLLDQPLIISAVVDRVILVVDKVEMGSPDPILLQRRLQLRTQVRLLVKGPVSEWLSQ